MEQWEVDYRAKLEEEISEGIYEIGVPPIIGWTGKGGYINFLVALRKEAEKYTISSGEGILGQIEAAAKNSCEPITEKDLREFLEMLEKKRKDNGI
jgi:hypothetical protein